MAVESTPVVSPPARPNVLTHPSGRNRVRWENGVRLHALFEQRCDASTPSRVAVIDAAGETGFAALDAYANRIARYLIGRGVQPGDRVGLLLAGSLHGYAAMLGVMKAEAAYVPLDAGFPDDRIGFILQDCGARCILALSAHAGRLSALGLPVHALDTEAEAIAREDASRPALPTGQSDTLAYIVYTSGTTGRPKGVPIGHRSICNFVTVAGETYGLKPDARMYQGLTLAFDFSVEEIWVPLVVGASLAPGPGEVNLVGQDLAAFLTERRVTAMCCVPTLLATLDAELPELDFLLVSGEACPGDLVSRWSRPGRRFLNAYGPTETTVTATVAELHPDRPVTIGVPLPTYSAVILAPDLAVDLPLGAEGELAIGGVALSEGYLNRDDLTAKVFIDDFLDLPDNPSRKLYRTGDLARIGPHGEIEYLGRIDTQVKIRGYRIELTEIESVLLQAPEIAQAIVDTHRPTPDSVELVAYYTLRDGAADVSHERLFAEMKVRLPSYMTPTFYERLDLIPMLPSNKADRKSLPAPKGARHAATASEYEPPRNPTESLIAAQLARIMRVAQVSAGDHFFDDLGANSLMIAQVCAAVREQRPDLRIAMKDMYLHPSVRRIARHLDAEGAAPVAAPAAAPRMEASDAAYVATGAAQLGFYVAYVWLLSFLAIEGLDWVSESHDGWSIYGRAVLVGAGAMLVLSLMPVALKWALVGRWTARRFPVWSADYLKFWIVKTALRSSPMQLFAGSPLYSAYLRLLGAKIGRDVTIFSTQAPIATDLLEIGDGALIRKDCSFTGYRAEAGGIETGPVRIGRDAYVGEASTFDIDTRVGDGAELGHASSLHRGQSIPAGRSWHGSPAVDTSVRYRMRDDAKPDRALRAGFTAVQLLLLLLVTLPAPAALIVLLHEAVVSDPASAGVAARIFGDPLIGSLTLYFGSLALGLLSIVTLPRLVAPLLREGVSYPLFGLRFGLFRWITRATNSTTFNVIFGDSSYVIHYLRRIGYRIDVTQQTGSNFGLVQRQDSPFSCVIGGGVLVSDGLSMVNMQASNASFRVAQAAVGAGSFLGNAIVYPPGGRTGENVLLATKVMVPLDGPVRENVGLLGSPAFEIPRSVRRDHSFDHLKAPEVLKERLKAKNRSNLATIGMYLASRWLLFYVAWRIAELTYDLHGVYGSVAIAAALLALTLFTALYFIALERISLGFGRMIPRFCSIYDAYYWTHERYWKLNDTTFIRLFDGTPFKNLIWRALGVRWGKKVFDDGCTITERTLVEVGDGCTLNELVTLQSHSLEDGAFKSDHVRIGANCTIGTKAYVSYGVTIEDGATLDPDSFLMKGETVAAGSLWRGNPAREIRG